MSNSVHAITGAFGYSGLHLTRLLLSRGAQVRNLTGHPDRPDPFGGRVEVSPLRFDDPSALRESLRGVRVLYNTYWVRFDHGASTFARAVERGRRLFRAAVEAGVERVVHVSITNPAADSPLPYFRGKAETESAVRESGLSYAILRPAVFFGGRDVLINNIAWLLRRLPVFGVAPGIYAVGPQTFEFQELVRLVRDAVGSRSLIALVPPWVLLTASRLLGLVVRDVVLTRDEVKGLTANLLVSKEPPTAPTSFTDWLSANGRKLGVKWASELRRHYE